MNDMTVLEAINIVAEEAERCRKLAADMAEPPTDEKCMRRAGDLRERAKAMSKLVVIARAFSRVADE